MNTDTVSDIQIQTGGVSASTPLGSGGVINIATASGTNRPKGAVSLYVQPRAWNGSNQPGGTSTSVDQTQIDLSFGGPLVRNHVWGFGSYRRVDAATGVSRSAAQLAMLRALIDSYQPRESTNEANFWFGKVTAQAAAHQIAGFYQADANPVSTIGATTQYPFFQATGGRAASLRVSSVWSNRLTTSAGVSYNDKRREGYDTGVEGPSIRIADSTIASGGRLTGNGQLATIGNPVVSRLTQPNEKVTATFDTTFYATQGSSTHELQAGVFAQRRVQGNHLVYTNGGFTLEEFVNKLVERRSLHNPNYEFINKAGKKHAIVAFYELIDSGDEPSILSMFYDVTDQKQAQVALQKSDEHFRKVFQTSPVAIVITTLAEGRMIDANAAFWKLSGHDPETSIGRTTFELRNILQTVERDAFVRELLEKRSIQNPVYDFVNDRSEHIKTVAFYELIDEGGVPAILSMFYDMTEQNKAQEALIHSEGRVRALLEATPDMIFELTRDGTIVQFIPSAEINPLIQPSEFIGKTIAQVLPSIAERANFAIERALDSGLVNAFEYQLQSGNEFKDFEERGECYRKWVQALS
jgi:PAS domain S-box-containing protein